MDKEKILQAGKIASQTVAYAKELIKPKMPLLEIAEKIEQKIRDLGASPAFPVNLSINEVAAHYTPSYNDETLAHGLLKVDIGVHVSGWVADTAFTLDLEDNGENKALIKAAEKALQKAIEISQEKIGLSAIGRVIQQTIDEDGFNAVVNLSGHSLDRYQLHSGITIPNFENHSNIILSQGLYAIEPFATPGTGKIHDGKPSGIYRLEQGKNTRSEVARRVLELIKDEYSTLPFCSRWIYNKLKSELGNRSISALMELKRAGIIHEFSQLIESSKSKVSQAEHTILIQNKEKPIITTQ